MDNFHTLFAWDSKCRDIHPEGKSTRQDHPIFKAVLKEGIKRGVDFKDEGIPL